MCGLLGGTVGVSTCGEGKAVSGLKVCVAGHVGECGAGQFAETGCEVSVSAMSVPRRGGGGWRKTQLCTEPQARPRARTSSGAGLEGFSCPDCMCVFLSVAPTLQSPSRSQRTCTQLKSPSRTSLSGGRGRKGLSSLPVPSPLLGLVGLPLSPCPPC